MIIIITIIVVVPTTTKTTKEQYNILLYIHNFITTIQGDTDHSNALLLHRQYNEL